MKKIFLVIVFAIISSSFANAQSTGPQQDSGSQNQKSIFPIKKSDYLASIKKQVEASWAFSKDSITVDEYTKKLKELQEDRYKNSIKEQKERFEQTLKQEEEAYKKYMSTFDEKTKKEFQGLSSNKDTLSKTDYVNAVVKLEGKKFDDEDTNHDGMVTEAEDKAYAAKMRKAQTSANK
jgi:hypothetical protein